MHAARLRVDGDPVEQDLHQSCDGKASPFRVEFAHPLDVAREVTFADEGSDDRLG